MGKIPKFLKEYNCQLHKKKSNQVTLPLRVAVGFTYKFLFLAIFLLFIAPCFFPLINDVFLISAGTPSLTALQRPSF